MVQFLHDDNSDDDAKTKAIPPVFSENRRAKKRKRKETNSFIDGIKK